MKAKHKSYRAQLQDPLGREESRHRNKNARKDKYVPIADQAYWETGVLRLAVQMGTKEIDDLTVEQVLDVFKKYIFFYLEKFPPSRKKLYSGIFDYLMEAEDFVKSNQPSAVLANMLFIFVAFSLDDTDISKVIDELRAPLRKGGAHSPWRKHSKVITEQLKHYHARKYKNKQEAITNIENVTGLELSENTFNLWWKKYKAGDPIFRDPA